MLLVGDVGLGLVLTVVAIWQLQHRGGRRADELGQIVTAVLASFGLAVLIVEGLLPGFWLIGGYALYGGQLEDLLPGATIGSLLRALAIGLVISTYASVRAYLMLVSPRRKR